ncbi:MAG: DUF5060 domain-containing protein [Saprospiraceae bacterium]|nr:DUF5060 domain-containing protein [Lewinella sp.]
MLVIGLFFLLITISCTDTPAGQQLTATQWDKVTLSFNGPELSESQEDNPFLNYRLMVTFSNAGKDITVPGFFAADGHAAESGADAGNSWQVRFRPDRAGEWTYTASFRKGENVAISDDPNAGESLAFDGETGVIQVTPNPDADGRLIVTDKRYLEYAGSGKLFLKGGADSPENFLGYADFDGTEKGEAPRERSGEATADEQLHTYAPHLQDWHEGDPSWQGGKGKGMIGALNYLAEKGMNSVYFLTMNIGGDGKDVWPYTGYDERYRFDCSKLDQWEIVFDHMDSIGLMLHMVTQETENELLLDNGDTGPQRKLYYRELIARFAHHLRITWNMGEENGPANFTPNAQNTEQQKAMSEYLKTHDPYRNYLVIHTHSSYKDRHELMERLLGFPYLDGPSIQIGDKADAHEETKFWIDRSAAAGKQWVVNIDEIGPANRGVDPDDREDNNQAEVRAEVLWGNLMAGGGGTEYYFGYLNHDNDLGCEDWRSRERVWDFTKVALDFFHEYLPFDEMESRDELMVGDRSFCLAKEGEIYAIYFPNGGSGNLDLTGQAGDFEVLWFNPRDGGEPVPGNITKISGTMSQSLGDPPTDPEKDWVALIRKEQK